MQENLAIGKQITVVSAASSLGLTQSGVERLADRFIEWGLKDKINAMSPVVGVSTFNDDRRNIRDQSTNCLNTQAILQFSLALKITVNDVVGKGNFPLVLGGDCSILLGIMQALKSMGNYGLAFIDAHADFYDPTTSTTGEVADMDLGIITGGDPNELSNIDGLKPYVSEENVVHIGQRDQAQAEEFGSRDIRETKITCHSFRTIQEWGAEHVARQSLQYMEGLPIEGFWIHFDTDVLDDNINPAVDYRLPGGIQLEDATVILKTLLSSRRAVGMSVSIYNPDP